MDEWIKSRQNLYALSYFNPHQFHPAPGYGQYILAATRTIGVKPSLMSHIHHRDGYGEGVWVGYGRASELRAWIPKEYAMMEEADGKG